MRQIVRTEGNPARDHSVPSEIRTEAVDLSVACLNSWAPAAVGQLALIQDAIGQFKCSDQD
jgi:hypothetical protein